MSQPVHLVLNSGGLRSLLATALAADRAPVALLFIDDHRPSSHFHHNAFLRQADHFGAIKKLELALPHLFLPQNPGARSQTRYPLAELQILTAVAGVALRHGLEQIVWPVQVGPSFSRAALITESIVMLQQHIALQHDHHIHIDTPLLDLTDQQLVETGAQMKLPWAIARSCLASVPLGCTECERCWRRQEAFRAAGVEDPLQQEIRAALDLPKRQAGKSTTTPPPNQAAALTDELGR